MKRNRMTAVVVALLLGGFGGHKFYLGRTTQGILYLLFFWTMIPAVVAFFEALYYLFMSDQEFQRRYS